MDMRCREQPEKWDDSGRDTKGCSSERHIYFWNLIKKLIHSSGNFYKSGSGEQPFVKRKWNRASLTVEASLALPVFLIAVLVLLKIVDLYRLHGMLTQLAMAGKLQEAAGIVVGALTDCDTPGRPGSARQLVMEALEAANGPVVYGLAAGHRGDTLTLSMNAPARLEAVDGEIHFQTGV